jgi:hypothetical protein
MLCREIIPIFSRTIQNTQIHGVGRMLNCCLLELVVSVRGSNRDTYVGILLVNPRAETRSVSNIYFTVLTACGFLVLN